MFRSYLERDGIRPGRIDKNGVMLDKGCVLATSVVRLAVKDEPRKIRTLGQLRGIYKHLITMEKSMFEEGDTNDNQKFRMVGHLMFFLESKYQELLTIFPE